MPVALACVIGNAVCAAVIPVVGVSNQKPNTACRSRSTTTELSETLSLSGSSLSGSGTTPSLGTFDVVTVPVHSNDRDPACASDDTISTDTSADSSRDVVILFPSGPSFTRQDIPLSCPRAYGLANTQAECGRGATLCLNRSLVPRIVTTPQEVRVFPPPSTSLMSLSQASRWPERAPSRQHSWNKLRLSASCGDQDFGRVFRG